MDAINIAATALNTHQAWLNAISNNIANINTPGYHAQVVDFASALEKSVAAHSGQLSGSAIAPTTSMDPTRLNGNTVSLEQETLAEVSNGLKFQAASQAMSQQFSEIRAAATVN